MGGTVYRRVAHSRDTIGVSELDTERADGKMEVEDGITVENCFIRKDEIIRMRDEPRFWILFRVPNDRYAIIRAKAVTLEVAVMIAKALAVMIPGHIVCVIDRTKLDNDIELGITDTEYSIAYRDNDCEPRHRLAVFS